MADDAPITLPTGPRPLHMGDSGADVRSLQAALNASGASPALTVDGTYGVGTRAAVAQAQRMHALDVTGIADAATVAALDAPPPAGFPFIQARHYTAGRQEKVRLIVAHSTESAMVAGVARMVANWFASAASPVASAHFIIDPRDVVCCVRDEDTAWHAPPVNPYAIGIEHCGRAAFTAADWAGPEAQAMLALSASLAATLCSRYGIPVAFVDADGLRAGAAGITTHAEVSKAFGKTDHVDPGAGWDMDGYLAAVAAAMVVP